jgi:hypothetical protein
MDSISVEIIAILITIVVLVTLNGLALYCISLRRRGTTINDVMMSSSDCAPDICQPAKKSDTNACVKIGKGCSGGILSSGNSAETQCSTGTCSQTSKLSSSDAIRAMLIVGVIIIAVFAVAAIWFRKKSSAAAVVAPPKAATTTVGKTFTPAPVFVKPPQRASELHPKNAVLTCGNSCAARAASGVGMPAYIKTIGSDSMK